MTLKLKFSLLAVIVTSAAVLLSACQQPDYSIYFTEVPGNDVVDDSVNSTATHIIAATEPPTTPTATATPLPTEAPPTETPTATATEILFGAKLYATDFNAGWPDLTTQNGSLTASSRGYTLDQEASWAQWTYTTVVDRGQFYASVDVTTDTCPSGDGRFGLLFHYTSSSQFRYFAITCDGQYILFERNLPSGNVLAEGEIPENILGEGSPYELAVRVVDTTIYVYLNGAELDSYAVEEVVTGDLGIYVESTNAPMTITFSTLNVYNVR